MSKIKPEAQTENKPEAKPEAKKNIPVAGPSITQNEIAYVMDAIQHGWYENANGYIDKFEAKFKKYLNRQYAVSLPSCTSALHLSLLALGIGPGDEVIVPDATWIASAAPISYVGAMPQFADMAPQTWCLCPKSVEKLISKKTKAIISVNLYGHMPDYDALSALGTSLGIPIIEDAAESIGSSYKDKLSGCFGLTSCFSFHGSKTLTTGEGGMLLTDDPDIYKKIMILRDHGRVPGDILFRNQEIGYKYKMSNLQAALGLAQLERIDTLVYQKRAIFETYKIAFEDEIHKGRVSLNPHFEPVQNSYWMTTLLYNTDFKGSKADLVVKLKEQGISTRPFFYPLSSLEAYAKHPNKKAFQKNNTQAYAISEHGINLPSAASLRTDDINRVRDSLLGIFLK